MAECRFCGYTGGAHNAMFCPETKLGLERVQNIEIWEEGYRKGLSGGDNLYEESLIYTLGWLEGVVEFEKADNRQDDFSLDNSAIQDSQNLN